MVLVMVIQAGASKQRRQRILIQHRHGHVIIADLSQRWGHITIA